MFFIIKKGTTYSMTEMMKSKPKNESNFWRCTRFILTNNIAYVFLFRIWTTFVQNCIKAKWCNLSQYLWKKHYRILISKFIWFISKYCELFTFSWAGPRSDSICKRISIQRLFWLQLWSWNKWLVNLWNFHIKFESETWASVKSSLKQQRKSWKKAQQVFIIIKY